MKPHCDCCYCRSLEEKPAAPPPALTDAMRAAIGVYLSNEVGVSYPEKFWLRAQAAEIEKLEEALKFTEAASASWERGMTDLQERYSSLSEFGRPSDAERIRELERQLKLANENCDIQAEGLFDVEEAMKKFDELCERLRATKDAEGRTTHAND